MKFNIKVFVILVILSFSISGIQSKKIQYKKVVKDALNSINNNNENQSDNQNSELELGCPNSLYISCGVKIKNSILECASEIEAEECFNNRLKDSPCYPCIEKIFPHFGEIQKNKKNMNSQTMHDKEEINEIIHHFATCGNKEQFECRRKLRNLYNNDCQYVQDKNKCMENKIKSKQCKVCICTIVPEVCTKKEKDFESFRVKDLLDSDVFEFLDDLDVQVNKAEKAHGDQEIKKDSFMRFGFLGTSGNTEILNSIKKVAGGMGLGKKASNNEDNDIGMLGLIMSSFLKNPSQTQDLLDKLDLDEEDFEDESMGFDDIQQILAQKLLENPEVLASFLENELSQEDLDNLMNQPDQVKKGLNSDDEDNNEDDEESIQIEESLESLNDDEKHGDCESDEKFDQCTDKIMTFLPSCIGSNPLECVQRLLNKDKCYACICRVLPGICDQEDDDN